MISRRSLFGFLAAAPFGAVAAVKAVAEAPPVDPPMIAVGEPLERSFTCYAGSITWVDPDYEERTGEVLRPIELRERAIRETMTQQSYHAYWQA